ncbi:MAG TPA: hypothetical protein VGV61_14765 [Thermoanaerobaculia bacterium]|nr:hypothetical protein [Thermoanaerobaculia bacterium]
MARALLALVAAATLAAPAAAQRLLLAGPPENPLRLRAGADGLRVEAGIDSEPGAAGRGWRLTLPRGGDVEAFVATGEGWLAAGSVPVTGGRELALWAGDAPQPGGGGSRSLPPPPGRHGALRVNPVPLVRDGRLIALAWLEGEALDRLAVWAASWDGQRWGRPVAVAPPGRGSQLALTGAVLADGTLLLAWSAYDGEDDEVLWSRGRGERWSGSRAVAPGNHVPDVTPTVRAAGAGALLAWSRYDGNDYRLLLARFQGGGWTSPQWVAGAGTALPAWEGESLVFRDAAHGAWVVAAVASESRLRVVDAVAAPPTPRPAAWRPRGELRLLFP